MSASSTCGSLQPLVMLRVGGFTSCCYSNKHPEVSGTYNRSNDFLFIFRKGCKLAMTLLGFTGLCWAPCVFFSRTQAKRAPQTLDPLFSNVAEPDHTRTQNASVWRRAASHPFTLLGQSLSHGQAQSQMWQESTLCMQVGVARRRRCHGLTCVPPNSYIEILTPRA